MSKSRKYTELPCGLKLRLDVETGGFDLVGDIGGVDGEFPPKIHLKIVSGPVNLMALSAFFLARAKEALKDD